MNWLELRFYSNGWRISIGPIFLRWNCQDGYSELTLGRVKSSQFRSIGGMTFREWKLAKEQAAKARAAS